ncbi:response regulator [Asticcacaulis sp. BYS171W]|uniref:Response regulator n=1 Tax=Asticcacaulis aquaticus TaxID=2984212 RepID=A0ABT5HYY7_9CAUL|nr:response regulator [Asticcacaulis aquaticus]MDC7685273.1 response regulator [Asticcacaulis aquaticus]
MTHTALIIEDSAVQANLIGRMVSAQPGWTHLHFPSFREGYEALSYYQVQAVFLDVFVGQFNAINHIDAFRKKTGTAPVVLMTAGSSHEAISDTLHKARQARADFELRKPFNEADIGYIFQQAFQAPTSKERRKTVLVIEDSRTLRTFIKGILEFSGYGVHEAETMEQAFKDVNIARVDAVLCDVFMPGMGGLQGMRHIKKTWPSVPVIAMSAGLDEKVSETEVLKATERLGADAQIAKPFKAEELLATLNAILSSPILLDV